VNPSLRRSIAVTAIVLAPVLSSCGFNQPTDRVYTPGVGVNERDGEVDVLNALVVSGAPGSGSLVATLSNNDLDEGDALVQVAGSGEDSALRVDLGGPLEVRPGASLSVSDEAEVSVEGEAIEAGAFVELTFTFQNAGTATLQVPVVPRRGPYADIPVPSVAPTTAAPEEEEPAGH
jgi:hypothetical protein